MASRDILINSMFFQICCMYKICKRRRLRRWRVRPSNLERRCHEYQQKAPLKLREMNEEEFFLRTRMPRAVFELLLNLIIHELRKPKQEIIAQERLSLTLLFLGHRVPIPKLANDYKLGKTTVRNIIFETCEIIWRLLSPVYVSEPSEYQYKKIAEDFRNKWDMPNCVGAIDGKHIAIKCPSNGSVYSIMLMAACDANYKFTAVSVEASDNKNDGGIFAVSSLGQELAKNSLPLPPSSGLSEGSSESFPHYYVDKAVFPLGPNIMRSYPGVHLDKTKRIFNYRLTRAHRVIENTFGILTARWQVLANTLEFSSENCKTIVLACVALHNFIMTNDHLSWYCPETYVDWEDSENVVHNGNWRKDLRHTVGPLRSITSFIRRGPVTALKLRDSLAKYFVNEGAVSFQDRFLRDPIVTGSSD